MKKLYSRLWQHGKSEDGQSMIEFVIVFPIFMMILAMILDFGWLFYNKLNVENSARNAARVACVEYTEVAYDDENQRPDVTYNNLGVATAYSKTYNLGDYAAVLGGTASEEELESCVLSGQEIRVLRQVSNTVPMDVSDVTVTIAYTYDKEYLTSPSVAEYNVSNRSRGDVVVLVRGTHHAISPFVALATEPGEGSRMTRIIGAKSVYKVETNSLSDQEGS